MKWTKIQSHPLAVEAKNKILENSREYCLEYHNINHITEMYDYLDKTNEPYSEALDWAVLYHDLIYDPLPKKEMRSADRWLVDSTYFNFEDDLISKAKYMIEATADHVVRDESHSAIIRADLHALCDPVQTVRNFFKIMEESMNLYEVNETEFATANIDFMNGLMKRVSENFYKFDRENQKFYKNVQSGIFTTIEMAELLKGKRYEVL